MNVNFTPAFINHTKSVFSKGNANSMIIGIKTVGCNGLTYTFEPNTCPDINDLIKGDNGTMWINVVDEIAFIINKNDYKILDGSKFDYIREGFNFRVSVSNPQKTSQCGCGESFNVS